MKITIYNSHSRCGERGVTMVIVAVGMAFMILAIAALAIDLTALYNARNEARIAADAAALAGARVGANSGISTDTSVSQVAVSALVQQVATAVAMQNKVGGRQLTAAEVTVNPSYAIPGSPKISVTVTRTDLPTFFARIWGNTVLPVSATAIAEAYNPSGNLVPIQPQCVKPWLLPNNAPSGGALINTASGAVPGPGLVGQKLVVQFGCDVSAGCNIPGNIYAPVGPARFYPVVLNPPNGSQLPATCALGSCAYEQNIAACSPQPLACGTGAAAAIALDNNAGCGGAYNTMTSSGTSCLIHGMAGPGSGQDCFAADAASCNNASALPLTSQFVAGQENPLYKDTLVGLGDVISNSSSLVTIPVYDSTAIGKPPAPPATVNVIGFVQGFIRDYLATSPITVEIYIVNISGCGPGVTGSPVLGDGVSPVPVHLISY